MDEQKRCEQHKQFDQKYDEVMNVKQSQDRDIYHGNRKFVQICKNNNNHHLILVGVLVILFTLYLTITGLHENYEFYLNNEEQIVNAYEQEEKSGTIILDTFFEYKNVCQQIEIFKKKSKYSYIVQIEEPMKTTPIIELNKDIGRKYRPSINANKRRNLKKLRRHVNRRIGNGNAEKSNNKSMKSKTNRKKDIAIKKDQQIKKNSTAEPIIYLFALVFIYLLLKATSDIYQHYKSQSNGNRRLRRHSLQSYAQAHKQDYRASKSLSSKYLPRF